jgi:hypothetical protein
MGTFYVLTLHLQQVQQFSPLEGVARSTVGVFGPADVRGSNLMSCMTTLSRSSRS